MATPDRALRHALTPNHPSFLPGSQRSRGALRLRSGLLVGATATLALTLLPATAAALPEEAQTPEQAAALVAQASHQLEVVSEQVEIARLVLGIALGVGSRSLFGHANDAVGRPQQARHRDFELELEIGAYFTVVTDDRLRALERMAPMLGLDPAQLADHPHALIGSVDEICDVLVKRREEYGISFVTVGGNALEAFAPVVERLAGT